MFDVVRRVEIASITTNGMGKISKAGTCVRHFAFASIAVEFDIELNVSSDAICVVVWANRFTVYM